MTSQEPNDHQINRTHAGAICKEIGERLRANSETNPIRLPPHLLRLMERFDGVEGGNLAFKASTGITAR